MKQNFLATGLLAGLLTLAGLSAACSSPKTETQAGDAAVVDTAVLPDTVTETASSDVPSLDVAGTDIAAPDVSPDVGPPVEVTYVTNVDDASDPTGAAAIVGQNAQLSADIDVVYPPDNAMAPRDFAPITVQWNYSASATPANTFILRFETEEAEIDIVGDAAKWDVGQGYDVTIPASIWPQLFQYPDHPDWTMRVIAANLVNGKLVGTMQSSKPLTFHVTNQKVGGAIYYWNTTLATVRVLESGTLTPKSMPGITGGMFGCTGCHSVSPDGSTIAVSSFIGTGMASMGMQLLTGKSGTTPSWLSPKAASILAGSFTIAAAFSPSWFSNTAKWLVVPSSGSLRSVNLLTGASYKLVASGDLGQQAFPTWSPNGETIVYASASNVGNGFSGNVATALYSVPFGDGVDAGKGGIAQPVVGADEPGIFHYYPAYTPDGAFIVYNRADPTGAACPSTGGSGPSSGGGATTYDNCKAEVWMIAAAGGTAIRLDNANQSTDALTNSWPTFGNVTGQYYWMAFSSRRSYGFLHTGAPTAPGAEPQVYIAAVDPQKLLNGLDGSYAALWLPGQDISSGCHIARWSATPRD